MGSYATVADVQARIPRQLCTFTETSQPTASDVETWLDQTSAWIDTTLRWKYQVPVTVPADVALLRPICAMLVAAQVWDIVGGHGDDQPNAGATLRNEARMLLVYDKGSGLRVASGQSNLVLPHTPLADSGEAEVNQAEASFSDPDSDEGRDRYFSMGMCW